MERSTRIWQRVTGSPFQVAGPANKILLLLCYFFCYCLVLKLSWMMYSSLSTAFPTNLTTSESHQQAQTFNCWISDAARYQTDGPLCPICPLCRAFYVCDQLYLRCSI